MWVQYAPNLLKPKKCLWVGHGSRKSPSRVIFPSGCSRIDQGFMHPKLSEHFPKKNNTEQTEWRNIGKNRLFPSHRHIVGPTVIQPSWSERRCRGLPRLAALSPRPFRSHQRSKAQNLQDGHGGWLGWLGWLGWHGGWLGNFPQQNQCLENRLKYTLVSSVPSRSSQDPSATHRPKPPTRHQPNSYHRTANDSKISIAAQQL